MQTIKQGKDYPDSFLTDVTDDEMNRGTAHTKLQSMTFDGEGNNDSNRQQQQTGTEPPKQEGAGRLALEGLVDGRLMLDIADGLVAAVVVWIIALFAYEVRKKDMRLTEGEKDILDPIVDKCLAIINWNFTNAWALLGVSLLFIYAGKAVDTATKKPKKSKTPDTGKPAKEGSVENAEADEVKQKQFHVHKDQTDMVIDLEAQRQPGTIYYSPEELKDLARQRQQGMPRLKKQLANANKRKGIKTVFLAAERDSKAAKNM